MSEVERVPLGILNNNPGNILASTKYVWTGQTGKDDFGHCVFSNPVYGLRDVAIVLVHYEEYCGCATLNDYIGLWSKGAKGGDNHYAAVVAGWLGADPDKPYDIHSDSSSLLKAIVRFENGVQPYPDTTINRALTAAHSR